MKITTRLIPIATITLLACSCSTPKNITYFQDAKVGETVNPLTPLEIRVKPEDKLSIMVNTPDPSLSTLFNLMQAQNRLQASTTGTKTIGANSTSSGSVSLYTVNPEGDINFPVLGKLHIAGMTRYEVGEYIENELITRDLVKDPIVTVEFANTGITVLGEVANPGRIEFNMDHMTIVDAIAMAGDLKVNGRREDILVLREEADGSQKVHRVNLIDLDALAASPVYYMQQNDVIYVEPNGVKAGQASVNENPLKSVSMWMSIATFLMSVGLIIFK